CGLLRQQHGIVPRQDRYRRAQSQLACARTKPGQQVERGRYLTKASEVVLDDEGAVESERLGLDVVVDEISEPFATIELGASASCRSATEEAEFHNPPPYCYNESGGSNVLDHLVGEGEQGMRLEPESLDRKNVVFDVAALAVLAFNELANSLSCSKPSIFWV